jgi:hypothetical protein
MRVHYCWCRLLAGEPLCSSSHHVTPSESLPPSHLCCQGMHAGWRPATHTTWRCNMKPLVIQLLQPCKNKPIALSTPYTQFGEQPPYQLTAVLALRRSTTPSLQRCRFSCALDGHIPSRRTPSIPASGGPWLSLICILAWHSLLGLLLPKMVSIMIPYDPMRHQTHLAANLRSPARQTPQQ